MQRNPRGHFTVAGMGGDDDDARQAALTQQVFGQGRFARTGTAKD
jgi:hypothetical protein